MRKVEVEIFDCKADSARPADNERVIVSWGGYWYRANYNAVYNHFAITGSCVIPFTDADEWYRPPIAGGK